MLTRRGLLTQVSRIGGVGALAGTMHALGLYGTGAAQAFSPPPPGSGKGRSVIILGAGIAGLVSAHELEQAGFSVTLIEARTRVGGRAWTVRDGDRIEMIGEETQIARFSDGIYFNAGPARLPSFHEGMLGYARRFGVPLEVEVNSSRSAYLLGADGSRLRMRTAINDMRGHLSELLAKAVDQGALDTMLSADDKERLRPFLNFYGDLDTDGSFRGTIRSGFRTGPGAGVSSFETAMPPQPLHALLANDQMPMTLFEEMIFMQATMFQPVGGMDGIARGIARNVQGPIRLNAEVRRIRQRERGVEVHYADREGGAIRSVQGDYLICTIPFPVLAKIDADFPLPVAKAIAGVVYDQANKVAFEAPRFWEREQIYGGISWVGGETAMIWYPSAGLHGERGMILGCYSSGERAAAFARRPIADQIAAARAAIDRVHPGHGADCANPIAVNWSKIAHSLGPWPNWHPGAPPSMGEARIDTPEYRLLSEPIGRIYLAGAALSQTPGWQEGALQSAQATVMAIGKAAAEHAVTERAEGAPGRHRHEGETG
ncbi:flavin monoamine oxidase family protein [Flavisphingomonas formosensis]|uniref:flavin monoamine oxidase family protein n=1 Tax=Flavisphingomonas formosensis TaxID=861534 RepID=UPI0012F72E61|nr:FAD-dependent oxidoreductase [Sphingomonas formosensis]